MNLSAWLFESWSMWRWRFNEGRDRRNYGRLIEAARGDGDTARVAELQGQLERSIASCREACDADFTERLVRQAKAKIIHLPEGGAWLVPVHGTRRRLTDKAIEDLRNRIRADRQSFWHLPLNWTTLLISIVSLAVAVAAYLKQ